MSFRILGLHPFTNDSKDDGKNIWGLWALDHCFKLPFKLDRRCEFNLSYLPEHASFSFYSNWMMPKILIDSVDYEEKRKYYHFDAPWARERYKEDIFTVTGWTKWDTAQQSPYSWEDWWAGREEAKKVFYTKFYIYEHNKKVPIDVRITAERTYYGLWWLPRCLKWIFNVVEPHIWIQLSEGIGKGRGSWKGGTCGTNYPFEESLEKSYLNWELNELPLYLEGKK